MDFIKECANKPLFKQLCPISVKLRARREDEELVLRFFVYSDWYKRFAHDVDNFLDKYVMEHKESFERKRMEPEFDEMLRFVQRHFGNGFAKESNSKATPRVRFEAISVGVNLALREKRDLIPSSMDWLVTEKFEYHTTTHASNSGPRLRGRVEYVRNHLLEG